MDMQSMKQPLSPAEFEQMSNEMARKFAGVLGDGRVHAGVVLSALLKVHRATALMLDENGRRHESFALAACADELFAMRRELPVTAGPVNHSTQLH